MVNRAAMASGKGSSTPGTQEKLGGVLGKKYPKGFTEDMLKPYILPNNQSLFKLFNAAVCASTHYIT